MEEPIATGVDHVHPHPAKTGHRLVDISIAVSALTISLISLFVAIEHGVTERRLVEANSWPFVEANMARSRDAQGRWVVSSTLTNKGVGPAQITSIDLTLDGRPVRTLPELLKACCGVGSIDEQGIKDIGLLSTSEPVGVLAAREQLNLMVWRETPGHEQLFRRLDAAMRRMRHRITYCSVLEDCWTASSGLDRRPTKVAQQSDGGAGFHPSL